MHRFCDRYWLKHYQSMPCRAHRAVWFFDEVPHREEATFHTFAALLWFHSKLVTVNTPADYIVRYAPLIIWVAVDAQPNNLVPVTRVADLLNAVLYKLLRSTTSGCVVTSTGQEFLSRVDWLIDGPPPSAVKQTPGSSPQNCAHEEGSCSKK